MKKTIILMIASIILLSGCNSDTPQETTTTTENDSLLQIENQAAVSTIFQQSISAGKGDAVFKPSGSVVYYGDPSVSDDFTVFCSKAGCQHNSEDCGAYIGNASEFIAYKDLWYYIRTMDDGSMILFEQNPITNERTELKKVASKTEDNKYYFITMQGIMVSYDCIYLRVDQMVSDNTNLNAGYVENVNMYIEINLKTKEERIILQYDSAEESWGIVGGNGKSLMITKNMSNSPQPSQSTSALYKMNLNNLSYEIIVDEEKEMLEYSDSYGNINADNLLTYCTEHEIHLYDLDTGEDELLYQINERIIRANIFDQNVFYIFQDENEIAHYMRGNTTGDTSVEMDNNGITDVLTFARFRTTENGYLGTMDGQFGWLSQEDYYQENYDAFVPLR